MTNLKAKEATEGGEHWDWVFRHKKVECRQATSDEGHRGPEIYVFDKYT